MPHLACSPDRRVYDTTEEDPWGLLDDDDDDDDDNFIHVSIIK